ncbi:MAG: hypothetical protein AAF727_12805 [Pseudomonadota bacterium]
MADQNLGVRASSVSLGITVVLLYVIFVMLVTFGFGSYIYRTTWVTDPPTVLVDEEAGEVAPDTDIDNNIFLLRREQILESEKLALLGEIRERRGLLAENAAQVSVSFGPIARAKEAMRVHVNVAIADLTEFQYLLNGSYRARYEVILEDPDLQPHGMLTALSGLLEEGMPSADADAETKARFEDVVAGARVTLAEKLAAVEAANAASHKIQQGGKVYEDEIAEREAKIIEHDKKIEAVREKLALDSVLRARLSSLSLNTSIAPNILLRLVSFPTIFLTLIVTIAAGALGTVVAFSRRYYSGNNKGLTLSRLFVNVGEGIAAAIAIFLFSGAGMLALTQGGGGVNNVELSPYTVAFIAFLSGFMAEDAFAAIQAAGKRIFATEEEEEEEEEGTGTNLPVVSNPAGVPATTSPPSS